jgi:hypothetical protein
MNGVLIQNNEIILGPTAPEPPFAYRVHPDSAPISIQDHGQALRFRNIWARPIRERPEPPAGYVPRPANLTTAQLDRFVGAFYSVGPGPGAPRYGQAAGAGKRPGRIVSEARNGAALRAAGALRTRANARVR